MPRRKKIDWAAEASALVGAKGSRLKAEPFPLQLATLADKTPEGKDWLHELKWDGYRLGVTIVDGKANLWSRNGLPWGSKVPSIVAALEKLNLQTAALDGELIAGRGTQADFNELQAHLGNEKRKVSIALVLFDLLHLEGFSIEQAPLIDRKGLLERLLASPPPGLGYSSHSIGNAAKAFSMAAKEGFEGIICKRADRPYVHSRGRDWIKVKHLPSDEYAVVGYSPPEGSRYGFGSLLLAKPDAKHGWLYAGRVGTGFNDALLRRITPKLKGAKSKPTVAIGEADRALLRGTQWFEPRFVVEVNVRGYGSSGILRQASFKALRPDKDPSDLRSSDRA